MSTPSRKDVFNLLRKWAERAEYAAGYRGALRCREAEEEAITLCMKELSEMFSSPVTGNTRPSTDGRNLV